MFGFFLINIRRLTMLSLAMNIKDMGWLQLQVFIQLNFVALVYIIDVKPFEKAELNFLNIINEIIGLFGSYIVLEL